MVTRRGILARCAYPLVATALLSLLCAARVSAGLLSIAGGRTALEVPDEPTAQTGLIFGTNGVSGGDIRLNWKGAALVSRLTHSVIVKAYYIQQTGYYGWIGHGSDVAWEDFASSGGYEYYNGKHPFPTDGSVNGEGASTGGTGGSGTVHYYEVATEGADFISTAGGSGKLVTKGVWVTHFYTSEVVNITGTDYIQTTFYPDIDGDPTYFIRHNTPLSYYVDDTTNGAFILGATPWTSSNHAGTGSGYTNDECLSARIRSVKMFDAMLSLADAQSEAASDSNSAVTSAGIASVWYINENPTPDDVTDKSGEGHHPAWANANRPDLWSSP